MSLTNYFNKLASQSAEPPPRQRKELLFSIDEDNGSVFQQESLSDDAADMILDNEIEKSAAKHDKKRQKKSEIVEPENMEENVEANPKKAQDANKKKNKTKKAKDSNKKKKTKAKKAKKANKKKETKKADNAKELKNDGDPESTSCLETPECSCSMCARLIADVEANQMEKLQDAISISATTSADSSDPQLSVNDVAVIPPSRKRKQRKLDNPDRKHAHTITSRPIDKSVVAKNLSNNACDNGAISPAQRIEAYPNQCLIPSKTNTKKIHCQACNGDFKSANTTVNRHVTGKTHIIKYVLIESFYLFSFLIE